MLVTAEAGALRASAPIAMAPAPTATVAAAVMRLRTVVMVFIGFSCWLVAARVPRSQVGAATPSRLLIFFQKFFRDFSAGRKVLVRAVRGRCFEHACDGYSARMSNDAQLQNPEKDTSD